MLQATTQISSVQWSGLIAGNDSPQVDDYTISIMADNNGPVGGSALAVFIIGNNANRTDSNVNFAGLDVYNFSADIDFVADAGTTYWLSIVNDTTGDTNDDWYWGVLQNVGNNHRSLDFGQSWHLIGGRTDFQLSAVPEPTSALIIGIGLVATTIRRRRQGNVAH